MLHARPSRIEHPVASNPRRLRAADVPNIPVDDPLVSGYELVDGELVPVMPSYRRHSWCRFEIAKQMSAFVEERGGGDVYLDVWCRLKLPYDPERLRAPDVAYFTTGAIEATESRGIFEILPELVIEVFSETNERKPGDFQRRMRDYMDAGVPLVWVIYPDQGIAISSRPDGTARIARDGDVLDAEEVLPGFNLDLGELFRRMP
jgi:Uma2 family endonuclease